MKRSFFWLLHNLRGKKRFYSNLVLKSDFFGLLSYEL